MYFPAHDSLAKNSLFLNLRKWSYWKVLYVPELIVIFIGAALRILYVPALVLVRNTAIFYLLMWSKPSLLIYFGFTSTEQNRWADQESLGFVLLYFLRGRFRDCGKQFETFWREPHLRDTTIGLWNFFQKNIQALFLQIFTINNKELERAHERALTIGDGLYCTCHKKSMWKKTIGEVWYG
jgi:hypothetical protein